MDASNQESAVLRLDQVSIRRGETWLIRDIQWEVFPHQNWVLLGPNGSGKTSLLSTLTGFLQITSGEIQVLGQRYGGYDWREMRKRIGFVSASLQKLIVPEELAIEVVIGGREASLDTRIEDVTDADHHAALNLLKRLGIRRLAERPWMVLSQGERQRVLIGRALMAQPSLLILDEPCAGLDPISREKFLTFLDHLSHRHTAPPMVYVTHHVEEIRPFFTHAFILNRGRAVASGEIREALTNGSIRQAFGKSATLQRRGDRYSMSISTSGRSVA